MDFIFVLHSFYLLRASNCGAEAELYYYFFCDLTLKTFLTFKAVSYSISIAINADVNDLSLTIIQTELFSSVSCNRKTLFYYHCLKRAPMYFS